MDTGSGDSQSPAKRAELAFLLDVDNTLLDNDALKTEIGRRIEKLIGATLATRFWELYEEVRQARDVVDYPTTVDRFIRECGDEAHPEQLREIFDTLSFADFLYPRVIETIAYLQSLGTVAILSDGDQVFQPRKIRESGLEAAVHHNVMICVHKEHELNRVFANYPADLYVMIDDKARILSALEEASPSRFTTVFVLQGHYATEGEYVPAPDFVIQHIADLRSFSRDQFIQSGIGPAATP